MRFFQGNCCTKRACIVYIYNGGIRLGHLYRNVGMNIYNMHTSSKLMSLSKFIMICQFSQNFNKYWDKNFNLLTTNLFILLRSVSLVSGKTREIHISVLSTELVRGIPVNQDSHHFTPSYKEYATLQMQKLPFHIITQYKFFIIPFLSFSLFILHRFNTILPSTLFYPFFVNLCCMPNFSILVKPDFIYLYGL